MTHAHLTDEQLIAAHVDGTPAPPEAASCPACVARGQQLAQMLSDVSDTATMAVDAAFSPERLVRQRVRILQRIEHYGRQARVLAFPVSRTHRPSMLPRPMRRWVAGAAAAGLVIGMVAGRMVPPIPSLHVRTHVDHVADESVALRVSSDSLADDELLREIEAIVGTGAGPAALRSLADVTPDVSDVQ